MKTQKLINLLFIILVFCHLFVFISEIQLARTMTKLEEETKNLKRENIDLIERLSEVNSLTYVASQAALIKLTKKITPFYLENLKYAFKP
ncbi:MAG: hypothetical protein N2482_02050 [Patescibacteria group bacterium]|nr:hypothetical protein [Patescibacteria group bacterium]